MFELESLNYRCNISVQVQILISEATFVFGTHMCRETQSDPLNHGRTDSRNVQPHRIPMNRTHTISEHKKIIPY